MKFRKYYLFLIFSFLFIGNVCSAKAEALCGCFTGGSFSRVGSSIVASSDDECNQYCANEKVKNQAIINYKYGDPEGLVGAITSPPKPITKAPNGEQIKGVPTNSCQCDQGVISKAISKQVYTKDECIAYCQSQGAKRYNYNYLVWSNLPETSKDPVVPPQSSQITDNKIPGTTESGGIVKCGRGGQTMCTLCDLISGLNWVIKYIMKIAVGVGLTAFAVAAVMYVISAGDSKMTGNAKGLMINAMKGFVIIFAAWLIVNFTIASLGARKTIVDGKAVSTFGMNIKGWGEFDCSAVTR